MRFSLLYFANRDADDADEQYRLLLESAEFADLHEFDAIWLPERHFHPFGGAYPNPALAAAAIATRTTRLRLRAGSVVLPINDVLRVVEDWSFVDVLSGGRVDLSFASGWNANDFVLAPERFAQRRADTMRMIEQVRDLWERRPLERTNGLGEKVAITTYPAPVQPSLQTWMTCASSMDSFRLAGTHGHNVLTAMLFMPLSTLAESIAAYREALPDGACGHVTLMLHTYVGESTAHTRAQVDKPFRAYLRSSADLWMRELSAAGIAGDVEDLIDFAFERYFSSAALFGDVSRSEQFAGELAAAGVDEIACLIDFGLDRRVVLDGLERLAAVRRALVQPAAAT